MTKHKTQYIAGFTLVELLIVLAISAIVLTGVLQVFNTSNKSYSVQEEVAAMQQNLRIAKLFLARDVRMAGAGMKGLSHASVNVPTDRLYGITFENNNGATGTDKLTIRYIDYGESSCDGLVPQLTLSAAMTNAMATITVNEDLTPTSWVNGFICDTFNYGNGANNVFKVLITSPNANLSSIIYITSDPGGGFSLTNAPYHPDGCTGDCNKVLSTMPTGSTVDFFFEEKLREIVYLVEDNVLKRSDKYFGQAQSLQPLAENIEDLQFAFGLDTVADGVVDRWVWNADLTDAEKVQVRSVRINLLGRTANRHQRGSQVYTLEDHTVGGQDGYSRRFLRTTVNVRNLAL